MHIKDDIMTLDCHGMGEEAQYEVNKFGADARDG